MNSIAKIFCLLVTISIFCGCKSYVTDKELQSVSTQINTPIKVVVSGLPTQAEAPDLILSFDDQGNVRYTASVGVGFSSGSGHRHGYYGHRAPIASTYSDYQVDRYGNQEQVAVPIIYNIEDWCKRRDTEFLKDHRAAEKNEIIISVYIKSSIIISKIPSTTVGISVGGVKNNTGAAVGGTWSKRDRCNAEIVAEYSFLVEGKQSETFKITVEGDQIKVKDQDAASKVYLPAAQRLAREIVYQLLELHEDDFFTE